MRKKSRLFGETRRVPRGGVQIPKDHSVSINKARNEFGPCGASASEETSTSELSANPSCFSVCNPFRNDNNVILFRRLVQYLFCSRIIRVGRSRVIDSVKAVFFVGVALWLWNRSINPGWCIRECICMYLSETINLCAVNN